MNKKVKWVGILSTAERNHIGLIRVRQNNVNSEVLGFEIIDGNGEPYDLKNRKVLFCTYFDRFAPVEQYAEVIENGKIIYTMNEHDMQKPVRINFAYFKIMDDKDNLVDTTQNFSYDIMPSIESKCMNSEPYIIRLEEVLDAFLQINTDAKKELEQIIIEFNKQVIEQQKNFDLWFESIRGILESIDPGGVILNELVEARGDFNRLSNRLNSMEEKENMNLIINNQQNLAKEVEIAGHRGLMSEYPESTISAFVNSILSNKADSIEFDIRHSLDKELYIIHDTTVDRTTDGTGEIDKLESSYIDKLDAGSKFNVIFSGATVPKLNAALKEISGLPFKRIYAQTNVGEINDEVLRKQMFIKTVEIFEKSGLTHKTTLCFPDINNFDVYRNLAPNFRFMIMCGSEVRYVEPALNKAVIDGKCSVGASVSFWLNNLEWISKSSNSNVEPIAWDVRLDHLEPLRKNGLNVMITDFAIKGAY